MGSMELSPIGQDLTAAMKEVASHRRGEIDLPSRVVQPPEKVDVAGIRQKLGLSQQGFADRFGFSVSAVRDWEQGRRYPDRSARILLLVIEREPQAVERALAAAS